MSTKLSILIPTLTSRRPYLRRLLSILEPQVTPEVELIIEEDDGELSIGAKRNICLDRASGAALCYCDDDDIISPLYVAFILTALDHDPDCVGFRMRKYIDGNYIGYVNLTSTEANQDSNQCPHVISQYRRGNGLCHLNPIRSSIAKTERFSDSNFGEDLDWIERIAPKLQSEIYIADFLYDYWYVDRRTRDERSNGRRQQELLQQLGILDSKFNIIEPQKKLRELGILDKDNRIYGKDK